jgi:hypothetical protein
MSTEIWLIVKKLWFLHLYIKSTIWALYICAILTPEQKELRMSAAWVHVNKYSNNHALTNPDDWEVARERKDSELLLKHNTYRLQQEHLTSATYLIVSSANYGNSRLVANLETKGQRGSIHVSRLEEHTDYINRLWRKHLPTTIKCTFGQSLWLKPAEEGSAVIPK